MKQLTAGSLFSGIGGIDLAFALAGLKILFQVEIDDFCQKVLAKHGPTYWPDAKIYSDVCNVGGHNLPTVDILFGGFPCQDISNAGKREGISSGKKSGLWREFKRIIGEIRPTIVFLENVPTITVEGRGGIEVITDLTQMGYDCRWGIVSADDAGAPHQRDRWFCVGHSNGKRCQERNGSTVSLKTPGQADSERFSKTQVGYTNGEQRQEFNASTIRSEARLIGRGISPVEFETVDNANGKRQQKSDIARIGEPAITGREDAINGIETEWVTDQSRMGRTTHGISRRLYGYQLMAHQWPAMMRQTQYAYEAPRMVLGDEHTIDRIRALGNAVVPQCVYPIAVEIVNLLS